MFTQPQFNAVILNAPTRRLRRLIRFATYIVCEVDWNNYYENIYIPNYNKKKQIRLIICESAPINIPNYMFHLGTRANNLNPQHDKYIWNIFRGIFPNVTIYQTKLLTKENALIMLAKENVLILDLLPTHGIKLKSNERSSIREMENLDRFCEINKITSLPNILLNDFNYIFSVPPNLFRIDLLTPFLPTNFFCFGNANIGQGHGPSIVTIRGFVNQGF